MIKQIAVNDLSDCDCRSQSSNDSYTKKRYNRDPEFRERMIASMRSYYNKVKHTEEYKAKRRVWAKAYYERHPEVKERKRLQSAARRQKLKSTQDA